MIGEAPCKRKLQFNEILSEANESSGHEKKQKILDTKEFDLTLTDKGAEGSSLVEGSNGGLPSRDVESQVLEQTPEATNLQLAKSDQNKDVKEESIADEKLKVCCNIISTFICLVSNC